MALIKCRNCNSDISDKAVKCPKCGTNLKESKNNKKGLFITVFALVMLVLYSLCVIYGIIDEILYNWGAFNNIRISIIAYQLFSTLFLWFIFAFYRFQKKAFRIISLIFLIILILCHIGYIIESFGGFYMESINDLMIWFFHIFGNIEILPMVLLYLFCQRDK